MDLVALRGVSFAYSGAPVLLEIDLVIREGDFLALIGPNGSGKTTLVKIILGLIEPSSGEVEIFGRPPAEFSEWGKIGYVPQKATHVDPYFPASVEEVVGMALLARNRRRGARGGQARAEVRRALETVGMGGFGKASIGRLSGGQQQRVFIARALVTSPRILFLDEPTTGVDAETQASFYDLLGRLNRDEGLTIVLITHDIGIVTKHVNRVACLNQRLVYHGDHEDFCRSAAFRDMIGRGDHLISHEH
ncbi:MAG TPA: metal ABC transporter ATP-binding protein [Candidatus Aminicenantes bacterium]|nr:metal ABC transporter ATP-binding protein [Candidatus Aminicenantes bacterium]